MPEILEIEKYRYVVLDGEFYVKEDREALFASLEQLKQKIIICCCYAPFSTRKERNLKDEEVRQCQPFELPTKGIFVDTTKPVEEIMAVQILPLLNHAPQKLAYS